MLEGRRVASPLFQLVGTLAGCSGGLAVFGCLYYSFVPASPGADIPLVTRIVPWVCLAVALAALAVAAWTRRTRPAAWLDMDSVFDDV